MIATISCLLICCALFGQNGWLPPVSFPANTSLCDPSPWKLIFYDDFNGNSLSSRWVKYISWDGMFVVRGNDSTHIGKPCHPDWSGARISDGPTTFKDENVIVSNGTCKLLMAYDPTTITFYDSTTIGNPLVTQTTKYSSGIITLPYHSIDGVSNIFNSGRFEACIKFPTFDGAWCAFWLWHGGDVNELDMAESWGGNGSYHNFYQNKKHTNYSMHAWKPADPPPPAPPNPYNLPGDCDITYHYPNQSVSQYIFGGYFRQEDWHTYAYEWDTASIKTYLDNVLISTIWKYCKQIKILGTYLTLMESTCNPMPGQLGIAYGYPWNSINSECGLRLETKWAKPSGTLTGTGRTVMGQMEIEDVKVWQKHPEKDGNQELCPASSYPLTPFISGPNQVCGQATFTLSNPITGGHWQIDPHLNYVSSTSSSITVQHNNISTFDNGVVMFSYGNGVLGCPEKHVTKYPINCLLSPYVPVLEIMAYNNNGNASIHLISDIYYKRDVENATTPIVKWDISLNKGRDSYDSETAQNSTLYGEFVSVSEIPIGQGEPYNLKWTVTVTNSSGSFSRSGERNSQTETEWQKNDTNIYYMNAYIDDKDYYDTTVYNCVAKQMISENESMDSIFLIEMIERIKVDALTPYLIMDNIDPNIAQRENNTFSMISESKVYPNPSKSKITIIPNSKFNDKENIQLNIYDLMGKLIERSSLSYKKGNIISYSLSSLRNANYILELKQINIIEHIKITKE